MATCTNKEQFSIGSPLADSIVMCLYPEMEIKTYFRPQLIDFLFQGVSHPFHTAYLFGNILTSFLT